LKGEMTKYLTVAVGALLISIANGLHCRPIMKSTRRSRITMALDAQLSIKYPRDFKAIPKGTDYGQGLDLELNTIEENTRMDFLETSLMNTLLKVVEIKKTPIFSTAEIAGDMVILDALSKAGVLDKVAVFFVDTYHLFPESISFLKEVSSQHATGSLVRLLKIMSLTFHV